MVNFHSVILLIVMTTPSWAVITLEESGIQYESYPANNFGRNFDSGYEYEARLQVILQDEYLCGGNWTHNSSQPLFVVPTDATPSKPTIIQNVSVSSNPLISFLNAFTIVALWVRQGHCSMKQKAITALDLEPKGIIQYLIVSEALPYHNKHKNLKTRKRFKMSHDEEYDLGVLVISYYDGQGLYFLSSDLTCICFLVFTTFICLSMVPFSTYRSLISVKISESRVFSTRRYFNTVRWIDRTVLPLFCL